MALGRALAWALLTIAALCFVLAVVTVARRLQRRRSDRRRAELAEPVRPDVLALVVGEPEEVAAAETRLAALPARQWAAVEPGLVDLLGKVRGGAVTPVRRVLAARGVAARARKQTGSRRAVRRGRAAYVLGLLADDDARPDVSALLADRDPDVRRVAARALGRLGDASSAAPLLATLDARRAVPAGVVADALTALGAAAHPAIGAGLSSPSGTVRAIAVEVAGLSGAHSLIAAIRGLLRADPEPQVRARAAATLGRLANPAVAGDLAAATAAGQPPAVRRAAAEALGETAGPGARDALTALLGEAGGLSDVAARALARLGPDGHQALQDQVVDGEASPAAGALALAALAEPGGRP